MVSRRARRLGPRCFRPPVCPFPRPNPFGSGVRFSVAGNPFCDTGSFPKAPRARVSKPSPRIPIAAEPRRGEAFKRPNASRCATRSRCARSASSGRSSNQPKVCGLSWRARPRKPRRPWPALAPETARRDPVEMRSGRLQWEVVQAAQGPRAILPSAP